MSKKKHESHAEVESQDSLNKGTPVQPINPQKAAPEVPVYSDMVSSKSASPEDEQAPVAKKTVWIKANRVIMIDGTQYPQGADIEVDEETAAEFCKAFETSFNFAGQRFDWEAKKHEIKRAERIEKPSK